MNSALEPLQSSALLTPCLWLSGPDLGLLTSRTLREYISVVLCHFACGSLWQPLQERITARILCNRFSIWNLETVASSYDRIWASFSALLLMPSSFSISNLFFRWESSDSEKLKKFPYLCYSQIFFFWAKEGICSITKCSPEYISALKMLYYFSDIMLTCWFHIPVHNILALWKTVQSSGSWKYDH